MSRTGMRWNSLVWIPAMSVYCCFNWFLFVLCGPKLSSSSLVARTACTLILVIDCFASSWLYIYNVSYLERSLVECSFLLRTLYIFTQCAWYHIRRDCYYWYYVSLQGYTALMNASFINHVPVAEALLQAKADVNAQDVSSLCLPSVPL